MNIEFSQEEIMKIEEIKKRYPEQKAAIMPVLWMAQKKFGWISDDVKQYVAGLLGLSYAHVHGVVSFYTMYFKKPIILTPYPVYKSDIAPLGFETIELNGANFGKAVAKVNSLIADGQEYDRLVEKNFKIGEKHFSYDSTREKIKKLLQTLPSV